MLHAAAPGAHTWPMYQARFTHNAAFANGAPVRWSRRLGGKVNGGLALVDGVLYAESFDRRLTAIDARTGAIRWSAPLPNVAMTTPIVADGLAIVGTGTARVAYASLERVVWGRPGGDDVIAFDVRTGRERWRYRTEGEDMPSPALVRIRGRDAIVFANGDDHARALDVRTGRLIWQRPEPGIATMSSAAALNGRVYVIVGGIAGAAQGNRLLALDARTGRTIWSARYGNADCSPAVADGTVLVEGSSSSSGAMNDVDAIDLRTGALRWRWFSGIGRFTQTASNEEAIAPLGIRGVFFESIPAVDRFDAFDARTGTVLWSLGTRAAVKMSPVERRGLLYFGDTGGTWYVVRAGNGRVVSERQFDRFFTTSPPVVAGRTLYVADDDRILAMILSAH